MPKSTECEVLSSTYLRHCSLHYVQETRRRRRPRVGAYFNLKAPPGFFGSNQARGFWGPVVGCEKYKYNMLVLLIRVLVISVKLSVVFIYLFISNDGLCLSSRWSHVGHRGCPLSPGPQRKVGQRRHALFLPTAEMVGPRVGLIGMKRGFYYFVFTLCNKHNCY